LQLEDINTGKVILEQDIFPDQEEFEVEDTKLVPPMVNISRWTKYLIVVLAIVCPALIACLSPGHRWAVSFMAYLNCLIYGIFSVYFLRKGTLGCLIPVLALLWLVMGSCLGIIYFAIFFPDGSYPTPGGSVSFFAGGVKYQLAIMLYLIAYLVSMVRLLRKESTIEQHPRMISKRIGKMSIYIIVFAISLQIILLLLPVPLVWSLWAGRLFVRYKTLLFVAGVVFVALSIVTKTWLVGFLLVMVGFFTVRNNRAMAVVPCLAFFGGLFFFSELKTRTKLNLALIVAIGLPLFLIISNTTRIILGPAHIDASMGQKLSAFKNWKSVLQQTDAGKSFFGRMYFTSGNVIVAYTPSLYSYKPFSPLQYGKEFAIYMLPDQVIRKLMGISDRTRKLSIVMRTVPGHGC
jgi:hypothetical protein